VSGGAGPWGSRRLRRSSRLERRFTNSTTTLRRSSTPELSVVHAWLDSWSGLGRIVVGMQRQGYELTLKGELALIQI